MCGIAGIFSYHPDAPAVDRGELRSIRDHMISRGPDGKGEWLSENNRAGLAHRRLSIIDLSDHGAQPMTSRDGSVVISYNGEIYNYKTLRSELIKKGYRFHSHSDTEVLIYLYYEYGELMLNRLQGMFSFALWDEKKKALFLARDPYGIKPLYYSDDGKTVRIASAVKAIMAGGNVSKKVDSAGRVGFYLFGSVPEPFTIFEEVKSLQAGHFVWVDSSGMHLPVKYFSLRNVWLEAMNNPIESVTEAVECVLESMRGTIRKHLVADVPVGVFLSGGIDSCAMLGLVSDEGYPSTNALTLGFGEFENGPFDETPVAKKIADLYGFNHQVRRIDEQEFRKILPNILSAMDQPSVDGINTYLVSMAAAEAGWKVALSGLGADELLGGYPSFQDMPKTVRSFSWASKVPFLGDMFYQTSSSLINGLGKFNPKLAGLMKYGGSLESWYLVRRGIFLPEELFAVLGYDTVVEGIERLNPLLNIESNIEGSSGLNDFSKISILESSMYMRNQLLRDADWASMAHSLEIRTPFVDAELLKQVSSAMVTLQCRGKKTLGLSPKVKLPQNIIDKKKTGFYVPISKWINSTPDWSQWKQVSSLRNKNTPWARRWAYTVESMWHGQ